jgi:deoxyribodipyrimidine photo-lyase
MVPESRRRARNSRAVNPDGEYVLYWMIAARRTRSSFALEHALDQARGLGRPLLVFEPLRFGYRWASPRFHRFVVDGMVDQRRAFAAAGVTYYPYVEPSDGHGRGLLEALAERACTVVTDLYPGFFHSRMVDAAAPLVPVSLEEVDGNGLMPLSATPKAYPSAAHFRRHLQKVLPPHLEQLPRSEPLSGPGVGGARVAAKALERWPAADPLLDDPSAVGRLGLEGPGPTRQRGGAEAGRQVLDRFLEQRLARYGERNQPDAEVASGLSPYLHFGHVGAHEVAQRVFASADWTPERLGPVTGAREGWWGLPAASEQFLDELVTWRELGFAFCHRQPDYDRYESLPQWARDSLAAHRADRRPTTYGLEQLAAAKTHDRLWNAAQTQLLRDGVIHNYLRMLWGKKVLEWSETPEQAWGTLIELNNRYALDGRDPNSYSGIGWTFGRFDRPWPERPIYGTIRYMTSDSALRKLSLDRYLDTYR